MKKDICILHGLTNWVLKGWIWHCLKCIPTEQ